MVLGDASGPAFFVFDCNQVEPLGDPVGDRLKILYWDGTGFWVLAKRLARGTFAWPTVDDDRTALELRPDELSALLGGIDLRKTTWRPWWRQPEGATPSAPRPPIPELPLVS